MIHETIKLFEHSSATLTTYVQENGEYERKDLIRPAVLICPGGGYAFVSQNEGEPVALAFARMGYHAFVLSYSVKIENPFPTALRELAKAMSIIRERAGEWLVDANDISVAGFSAGGNLALSLGIYYQDARITDEIGLTPEQIKPNQLILGYPAVTLEPRSTETPPFVIELMEKGLIPDFRGPNIREILMGKENLTEEEERSLNLLQYVNGDLPRTFIWGTYEDSVILPTDLLGLASKLFEYQVPCELHLFEKGPHGMSLGDATVKPEEQVNSLSLGAWVELSAKWLEQGRGR
ncbi:MULTISPECIES: alpha/beta hydrolase [Paenibacillus]|jgi:acetyl esterase/lipase|uniref:alpha/beta hydrolase n=1 Tax=Paenibacillus TaxID=44249 RepID=UPI00073EEC2A|nr:MULTISPECIES: alpha/beta hydrolase [Paenibacillus]MDU2241057.1 alpha/beta hydrolase [Paenibacillus sp.]MDU4697673.1 alpha/beta hydrolase [Paenibacillus sp.]